MENTCDSECQLKRTSYFSDAESSNKNQARKRSSAGIGDHNPNHHPIEQHAQPLIRAAWAGHFLVYSYVDFTCETFEGLKGFVSSRACAAVRSVAERLPATIKWKKVPRASVWPKSFERKAELLLFTSVDLPPLFTRFQGSLYLWGVFRGDQPCY